ncbi:lipopolysaccharide core heptose(I) kinase RfaP [Halioglobus maricola]|uniref:Lipopolysaccharide core heptose(I) kinase n=1 Tax=Halioglobus maricola TaxID=2601894 RepID=A0A5P9NER1_9GAMM|nr:lipopolysaccharide core heptose(I) kinase RfaP [Halioglobus maricola]QFU74213.1 lipopolysaccharide core heptose(I) kinase RfaP [Halioglobus maricola]
MPESYLRQDIAASEGLANTSSAILSWGEQLAASAAQDDIFRNKEGRKTLRFSIGSKSFFLKLHSGVGWGEIVKNLLQLRLPILGASNEYRAVLALSELGVDTMSVAAYASSGANPAQQHSLIVTDDLVGTVSLEDYCMDWASAPPEYSTRLKILLKLADSAGRMHRAGINHRDFYICHFHLDESTLDQPRPTCHIIDLHRAQLRARTPRRWRVKDIAGLYFSAMDCGLSRRDLFRFIHHYTPGGLRAAMREDASFWGAVERTAQKLYRRVHGREPPALMARGRS